MHGSKRLLILSLGPFPTPEQTKVEGGGLRSWGLARGLQQNLPELDISLAFLDVFKKQDHTSEYEGVSILTWNIGEIPELIADYDAVLMSYCMGDVSVSVAENLRADQQLILDCYVPIYVEASARDSTDLDREYNAFKNDVNFWNRPLLRGDLFLCAHVPQKRFYQGVLSAMGRINPVSYGTELLLEVPYGIHRQEPTVKDRPISRMLNGSPARRILWFGGIYPWFDLKTLIDAVGLANRRTPTKLVVVGGKNPFTQHPDFLEKYRELERYAERPEHRDWVLTQDWVAFDDRADWYMDADLVVVVNKPGDENELAWRTRLVDFTWANVPIVTNGGDPLGEAMIAAGAAARFPSLDAPTMAETLVSLLEKPAEVERMRASLQTFKQGLFWDVVTRSLARAIDEGRRAPDLQRVNPQSVITTVQPTASPTSGHLRRVYNLTRRIPSHIKRHGIRSTALKIQTRVARHFNRVLARNHARAPGITVLGHQLNLSGAPFVLLDVMERLVRERLRVPIELFSYLPVHDSNLSRLQKLGLRLNLLLDKNQSPPIVQGDVVLLNTVAFNPLVRDAVLAALERGLLRKLVWYAHEDSPSNYFSSAESRRIGKLLRAGKITMFAPSRRTCQRYRDHFDAEVFCEYYHIDLPDRFRRQREADDFSTLRFVVPGSFGDGRKGQLPILYAFAAFLGGHYCNHPELYRDFTLTFIGLEDDHLSRQVREHQQILGPRLVCLPKIPREKCLEEIHAANMTICYSLEETMGIFVFEGMLAGHPILRNGCSGVDEQLEPGRNGLWLDSHDFWQVVQILEKVLNLRKTSNQEVAGMSARSYEIALRQRHNRYDRLTNVIRSSLRHTTREDKGPHLDRAVKGPHLDRFARAVGAGQASDVIEAGS